MTLTAPTTTARSLVVRPAGEPGDEDAIRGLFRATVNLGCSLPFDVPGFEHYERLCLDWYLSSGRDAAAVAVGRDGEVEGYALVCVAPHQYRRWLRRHAAEFSLVALGPALHRTAAGHFYRLRLRDGFATWRRHFPDPMPAHAHINLAATERAGRGGRLLVAHVDQQCRDAALPGWFGEINAPVGHRAAALERLGGTVACRVPNRTLSWLAGRPVERLTVVRTLDPQSNSHSPPRRSSPALK